MQSNLKFDSTPITRHSVHNSKKICFGYFPIITAERVQTSSTHLHQGLTYLMGKISSKSNRFFYWFLKWHASKLSCLHVTQSKNVPEVAMKDSCYNFWISPHLILISNLFEILVLFGTVFTHSDIHASHTYTIHISAGLCS